MRHIDTIVIHCTGGSQTATVKGILNFWKRQGWSRPGYHYLIEPNGRINNLHPIEKMSNGVKGYNKSSVHVSYIGGVDGKRVPTDNRTKEQIASMITIIKELKNKFPDARILGHRDFPNVKKACPSFDVRSWLDSVNIES